jgi:hypothetical protein
MHGAGSPGAGRPGGRPPTHGIYSKALAKYPRVAEALADIKPLANRVRRAELVAMIESCLAEVQELPEVCVDQFCPKCKERVEHCGQPIRCPTCMKTIPFDRFTKLLNVAVFAHTELCKQDKFDADTMIKKYVAQFLAQLAHVLEKHVTASQQEAIATDLERMPWVSEVLAGDGRMLGAPVKTGGIPD